MLSSISAKGQAAVNMEASAQKDTGSIADREILQQFAPTAPVSPEGFLRSWGWQPFLDLILGKLALKRISPLVPHTLIPIIKICSDNRNEVDAAYKIILGHREPIHFFDSPREKWRKLYGNFVRELEWACMELRKYFNKRAYEDLVINTTADYLYEALGPIIEALKDNMIRQSEFFGKKQTGLSDLMNKMGGKMTAMFFKVANITGWLAGDCEILEVDLREGLMVMEYKDCLMLRSPRLKNLPEESCLLGCKGSCEKLFKDGPVRMTLDARLPETTCEVRMFIADKTSERSL